MTLSNRLFFAVTALVLSGTALADEPLSLRTATAEQLASLDDVDPATAEQIVSLREERGRIGSVEELRVIPGIDSATLDSLRRSTAVEVELALGEGKTYSTVDEVMAEFAHEPTVQQVQGWAADYARLNPGMVDRWMAASRSFAALPRLQVEYRFQDGWDQDFLYFPADGTIDTPDDSVYAILDDAGKDQDQRFLVRATWDLDELVMSSERIRIINESQDIVKLRDKVLTEVTRLYFERRRVQVELLLKPPSDVHSLAKEQLRLMELTANIDALTGGTFSEALLRAQ